MLCERGILPLGKGKSFTRYTLDWHPFPSCARKVTCRCSRSQHATGRRDLIHSMSLAAVAAGANALMIEAHTDPELSLVDAAQTVNPDELREIIDSCRRIRRIETAVV